MTKIKIILFMLLAMNIYGQVYRSELGDTAAAIRGDFPAGGSADTVHYHPINRIFFLQDSLDDKLNRGEYSPSGFDTTYIYDYVDSIGDSNFVRSDEMDIPADEISDTLLLYLKVADYSVFDTTNVYTVTDSLAEDIADIVADDYLVPADTAEFRTASDGLYQAKDSDLDSPDLALNLVQDSLDVKMNRDEMSGFYDGVYQPDDSDLDNPDLALDLVQDSLDVKLNRSEYSPGGGSSKEYASFYLTTGGVTGVAATATTLVINNTGVNSDGAVFSLASNEVTVNKTGTFLISVNVYFNTSGSSRSEYSKWLEVDTGGGYAEVAGSRFVSYQRGYDSGQSASLTLMLDVTSGDKFRLRVQRTDGGATTGYQDANGTRFTILEL